MNTVTIGYHTEDRGFAVLATLNNKEGRLDRLHFLAIADMTADAFRERMADEVILILERADAPDYVDLD